ncbi:MAG: hypothetical protein AABZ12_06095 [Planctomycetota bacterium]
MSEILAHSLPEYLAARRSARRRDWGAQAVALTITATCLVAAGFLVRPINHIRSERQLVIDPSVVRDLPPELALLGKLGTFRALAIDWAAIRAERLKEQGKVYEALQLHNTVCALAPRFPDVWVFAAWNMAYNISVMQYTPEARWQWVTNGIQILRDRAIQYNPRCVTLYKELSWIYWHKIGDFLDDEHLNYKRALAVEMERILGPQPLALNDREYFDWFRRIVDAPRDLDLFLERDEEVARLLEELGKVKLGPDEVLLDFVARRLRPELRPEDLAKDGKDVDSLDAKREALLRDPAWAAPRDRLLSALRSKTLRQRSRLDLDAMMSLMVDEYGPLDWRNAFSHSLYWSTLGDRRSEGYAAARQADAMNTARFVFFSLQNLVTRGRMTLYPNFDDVFRSYIELTPDTRFIPYLYDTYMRLGKKHFGDDPQFRDGTPGPNYMTGFVSSMHNWIQLLYLDGGDANQELAENYYAWLRKNNPHPDGRSQEQYLVTLDEFVMGGILGQMETYRAAHAIVGTFIRNALKHFALGQPAQALHSLSLSRKCYDFWMADASKDINDRRKMQPPVLQLRDAIEQFFQEPSYDALGKARLWNALPLEQRRMVYDAMKPLFVRLCESQVPPWDALRAFPEPEGMEEFRRSEVDFLGKPREELEQGTRDRN